MDNNKATKRRSFRPWVGVLLTLAMVLTMLPRTAAGTEGAGGTYLPAPMEDETEILPVEPGSGGTLEDDFEYLVDGGTATVTWYAGAGGDVVIPDTLGGFPVKRINDYAFYNCESLTGITIPDSVESIGANAFYWCHNLTTVTIPDGVTDIEEFAFWNCSNLSTVTIPGSVTGIGGLAFCACPNLTKIEVAPANEVYASVDGVLFDKDRTVLIQYPGGKPGAYTIPSGVTAISDMAFYNSSAITSVTIPGGVESIGELALCVCPSMTRINVSTDNGAYADIDGVLFNKSKTELIQCPGGKQGSYAVPGGVTGVGDYAFGWCSGLTGVTIPDSVTSIGLDAFDNCVRLTQISVASANTVYAGEGGVLFSKDKTELIRYPAGKKGTYTIPSTVTTVGADAFYYCQDLTGVTIPGSVKCIGHGAFEYCTNLTSLTIPDSVESIGYDVLYDSGLYSDKSNWTNGVLYVSNCLIRADKNTVYGDYRVLTGTRLLADYAFSGCERVTSVTFAGKAPIIGEMAFGHVTATVYYPYGNATWTEDVRGQYGGTLAWESYGEAEFTYTVEGGKATITGYNGDGGDVTIPALLDGYSVTAIGDYAFANRWDITAITIPEGVTGIGKSAFTFCQGLKGVILPNSMRSIDEGAFWNCVGLAGVTIPRNVTYVAGTAFAACTGMQAFAVATGNSAYSAAGGVLFNKDKTELVCCPGGKQGTYTVPAGVKRIGMGAFEGCTSLTGVLIPDSVNFIGEEAFRLCLRLVSLSIPTGVQTVSPYTFHQCEQLTDVTIPGSVTSIGAYAFCECGKLTGVVLPSGLTGIGDSAFRVCQELTDIEFPAGVTEIGDYAFAGCSKLSSVTFAGGAPSIQQRTFGGVTATVYYPATESTWTESVRQNYSGALTWEEYGAPLPDYQYSVAEGTAVVTGYNGAGGDVTIPAKLDGYSVTGIDSDVFRDCTSLTSVTIPGSVTSIGEGAFSGCTNLTEVKFRGNAPDIGVNAFADVTATVYYPEGDPTWTEGVRQDYGGVLTWTEAEVPAYLPGDLDEDGEVTDADAIYLLMYTFFEDDYPVSQPCDYDGDGEVTDGDAIYLLMYTFFPEDYPIA